MADEIFRGKFTFSIGQDMKSITCHVYDPDGREIAMTPAQFEAFAWAMPGALSRMHNIQKLLESIPAGSITVQP